MNGRVRDAGQRAGTGMGRMGGSPVSGKTAPFSDCVSFSMSLSLLCPPHCWETSPAAPGSPESHLTLQVSAATGLRGHGLGTPRLPQLAKGGITVLNAGAHPLGVQLTWGEGGERSGPAPGNLWALPSTPKTVSWGSHLSRSCSEWCGHTSGMPPPHSHP